MTFKQRFQNFFFPLGSIQKIRLGYLKNYRIRLTLNSLWSPLIGNWEPSMQKIMMNVIHSGDTAYDLGANNGLHGLLMSGLVGKDGIVYNFEPLEENIAEIVENFQLNGIVNYRNIQSAVSDRNGTEYFTIGAHNKQGKVSGGEAQDGNTLKVDCITLDKFIGDGAKGPSFIKMDIEGAEGGALRGFAQNIQEFRPLMIIELHSPDADKQVGEFLNLAAYKAYRFDPFAALKFEEVRDFNKVYPHPDGIWGTIFCIPPGKELSSYTFDR